MHIATFFSRRLRRMVESGDLDERSDRWKGGSHAPRYSRRLSDKILIAFHQACDQNDLEDAELLWAVLETVLSQRRVPAGAAERRAKENLDGAYERLRQLRHSDPHAEFDALLE
jgi:hypothetical protein